MLSLLTTLQRICYSPMMINEHSPKSQATFATLLYLLGIEHLRLTVKFQGLDARLTGVSGEGSPEDLGLVRS